MTDGYPQLLRAVAVILMLAGVVMLFAGPSEGIAFPLIAAGIALTAILHHERRRTRGGARHG